MRDGKGGCVYLDATVHERLAAKPMLASVSLFSLSPAPFSWRQGVDSCKEWRPMKNGAADQESTSMPADSSPPRARPLPYQKVATTTLVLGSVFLVYSCCVIDAKVLLQLYKN
jgi:hypothetical protein